MKIKKHKSNISVNKIKKIENRKEKMVNKIASFLEMPEELFGDTAKITVVDNNYLYLEGKNQIEDYYNHYIRIKTKKTIICLDGKNMEIKEISDNELCIYGQIISISYESRG